MTDPRLVLPHDVEGALVTVLKEQHAAHLAKMERLRNLQPKTFEPFVTVARMSDVGAARLSGDTVPALLLGVIGAPDFRRNEDECIDAVYQLGMQVTVMGQSRSDTLFRRDVMAWTAVECMYQRVPRGDLINSIRLTDYEPLSEADTQRTLGDARMIFEVGVPNALSITGYLPVAGSDWPPEGGGTPVDPYDPPEPRPVAELTFTVDKQPTAE